MEDSKPAEENKKHQSEAIKALSDALVESGRRSLEYEVEKYKRKRGNGNVIMMGYYQKKLYQAILALRDYNDKMK